MAMLEGPSKEVALIDPAADDVKFGCPSTKSGVMRPG
jgi:hypothetical protein